MIVEILYKQAKRHPERLPLLEAYLERVEVRTTMLLDRISRTGDRMLHKLETTRA